MNNKKLIIGNWKMNPATLEEAKKIAQRIRRIAPDLKSTETVIAPPLPFMAVCSARTSIKNFSMGAQSVSVEVGTGPHTGEVSADMVKALGAEYVIVGHSEMRAAGDTDATVNRRLKAALSVGLIPVVCIGETIRDEAGSYLETLKQQIKNTLADVVPSQGRSIVIAYEPVWAIGGKEAMRPEDIYETSLFIKKTFADIFGADAGLKTRVLYGGSVNFRNAPDIISIGKVDGLLVGRESVNAPGFIELLKAVDTI